MATAKSSRNRQVSLPLPDQFWEDNQPGSETEADLSGLSEKLIRSAVVFSTDWTTETVINQLTKKAIDLDPAFQRRDAWTTERKSLFIESLILGLPIPQIVLAERKGHKGSFIVIDGKQRLLSLQRFTSTVDGKEPFALKSLKLRADLNDCTFADLKKRHGDLSSFENQTIRTVVIRNWQREDLLYLIFHRLNSQSLPLSPQELRQALHPGPFLTFADEHCRTSVSIMKTLGLSEPDFRMRDVELLVRFFAFRNFGEEYRGNLKDFLDTTCDMLNKGWSSRENQLRSQAGSLDSGIELAYRVFRGFPFRKWNSNAYEGRFNRAVFDVISYYFSRPSIRKLITPNMYKSIESSYKRLCTEDLDFIRSIETTTKSKTATSARFEQMALALSTVLGHDVKSPIA